MGTPLKRYPQAEAVEVGEDIDGVCLPWSSINREQGEKALKSVGASGAMDMDLGSNSLD